MLNMGGDISDMTQIAFSLAFPWCQVDVDMDCPGMLGAVPSPSSGHVWT